MYSAAIELMEQIAKAFVFIHSKEIKHGDLKPQNILIHEGIVKISDFGFADSKPAQASTSAATAQGYALPPL